MPHAVLIGPDVESMPWVAVIAAQADVPYVVLEKVRRGDREVYLSLPAGAAFGDRIPVLVDDIILTDRTMVAAIRHLERLGKAAPVCVGVLAVFAPDAHEDPVAAGAGRVVTCNTIAHPSNAIDVAALASDGVRSMLDT